MYFFKQFVPFNRPFDRKGFMSLRACEGEAIQPLAILKVGKNLTQTTLKDTFLELLAVHLFAFALFCIAKLMLITTVSQ